MSSREADRFWAKVQKTDNCWLWTGARNELGYGSFGIAGRRTELAHRASWRLSAGEIPAGLLVCHHCDNPPCVRPDHLFLGTNQDNVADQIAKGRRPRAHGQNNSNAKLTDAEVAEIRTRYGPGVRIVDLAAEYGISKSQIWNIVSGKQWNEFPKLAKAEAA